MSQPNWRFIANLGDATPLDYGGAFLFADQTGVYSPEIVYWEDQSSYPEGSPITVYRFIVEPCTYVNGVLSDNPYHPDKPAWFADDIPAMDFPDLIERLISPDILARASAWIDLVTYYGIDEFDQYPNEYFPAELADRIKTWTTNPE